MKLKKTLLASSLALSSQAFSAVPTGVDTAITALQADSVDTVTLIIPAVIAVTSIMVIVKVIKRVLNKVG